MSLRERLDAWLTERRLRLYPRALLAGLIAGAVLGIAGGDGTRSLAGRLGGDFPAFYSGARIASDGALGSLYDFERQARVQAPLFLGGHGPEMLPFAYPPYVALLYAPLSWLPYRAAYVLHTLLMACALWLGVRMLRGLAPRIATREVEAFALALGFVPTFLALVGGQATPLLLCALSGVFAASAAGHDLRAGLWLGLLFLKPQYALPLIALFALARRARVVATALGVGALCYAAAAVVLGADWPVAYLTALARFQVADQRHNAAHSIGLLGVTESLLGPGKPAAVALGLLLAAACGAYLVRLWTQRQAPTLATRLAVSAPLLLLLSPHAMQYDAALLVPSLAVLADRGGRRAFVPLGALYLAATTTPLADSLGVTPAFGVVLGTLVLAQRKLVSASSPWRELP